MPKIERWRSDDNRQEIHLFRGDRANGYILGYNPELIPWVAIVGLLGTLGFDADDIPGDPSAS